MTPDEYRAALGRFTEAQFAAFRASWGGSADTIEACVQEYAYAAEPEKWDRIAVFRLKQQGATGMQTESEKSLAVARDSADAAKASAVAAAKSAEAAGRSVRAAWYAIAVAALTAFVTLAAARGW